MSPEHAMRLVEDSDLDPNRTTSMQSITEHLQRAAASLTEATTTTAPLAIATAFSSPPQAPISHSPKRNRAGRHSHRTSPLHSPLNSPLYRQQLADMVVNGMENRTFGSRNESPIPEASRSVVTPLPSLTPVQIHSIEDGCLVPDVYRASAAGSFRNVSSVQGSFRGVAAGGLPQHNVHQR
jgi:hypothetical protein